MKRFVTYLYEYENGQKIKNVGFLRVDIRNQMVSIQVNIRYPELEDEAGNFYIIVRGENVYKISIGEVEMKEGECLGTVSCRYQALGESSYSFTDAIGVGIQFEGGCCLASSWRDDADEVVALGEFTEYGVSIIDTTEAADTLIEVKAAEHESDCRESDLIEEMEAATLVEKDSLQISMGEIIYEGTYQKINLNEIATLPSCNWHYTNNSFLIHGFWNYGYLVLKETFAAGEKKLSLGVPGIFEQPEMVMATCFGFPTFEAIPSQVEEMVVGERCPFFKDEKNQKPKEGTFGCWFVNL